MAYAKQTLYKKTKIVTRRKANGNSKKRRTKKR